MGFGVHECKRDKHTVIKPLAVIHPGGEPAFFKEVKDLTDQLSSHAVADSGEEYSVMPDFTGLPKDELKRVIAELEVRMRESAEALEFEVNE